MNPQIAFLATSFKIGAYFLGLPSIGMIVWYVIFRLRLSTQAPTPPTDMGKNPDAVLLTLGVMARAIGAAANVIGGMGKAIFTAAAVLSVMLLIYAIGLWFTGRGLNAQSNWARWVGGALVLAPTLICSLSVAAVRGPMLLVSLLITAFGLYALKVLWHGYAV